MTAVSQQRGERQAGVAGGEADLGAAIRRLKVQVGFDGEGVPRGLKGLGWINWN